MTLKMPLNVVSEAFSISKGSQITEKNSSYQIKGITLTHNERTARDAGS
ncbi:MAG: hypothetical protein ACJAZP_003568 [Psychromonas sp.]|jgi:hypothetical protein